MINYLLDFEQNKYPFYNVVEVDVLSNDNGVIKYKTLICSKIDSKWKKWEPIQEINISKIIEESRNDKIDSVLL